MTGPLFFLSAWPSCIDSIESVSPRISCRVQTACLYIYICITKEKKIIMSLLQCLATGWPSPVLNDCVDLERTMTRDWVEQTSDMHALETYLRTVHYLCFVGQAIAHATYLVNFWPSGSRAYRIHWQISNWSEIAAYMVVGGMIEAFVVMLTYPLPDGAIYSEPALQMLTIASLFFVKGMTHLSTQLTHSPYTSALEWVHMSLVGYQLWNLDQGDDAVVSVLYRFAATAYGLAVALSIHRSHLKRRERWLQRGTDMAMHLCLFAAHVMLTEVGSRKPLILLQWTVMEPEEADMPTWRPMIFDWVVVSLHTIVQLLLILFYVTDKTKRHTEAWRQREARVITIVKWCMSLALLVVMMVLILVNERTVVPDFVALRNCSSKIQ